MSPCTEPRSVPSVVAVYATLRRQSAWFNCRSPASSLSTLHVCWARTCPCMESRFQEPARSCFLLLVDFYAKLSQSSTRVWPVILTSGRSPVGTGRDAMGFQRHLGKRWSPRIYSKQTLRKLVSQPHLRRVWAVLYTWTLQFTTGHVRFPLFFWVRHHHMVWCWFVTRSHDVQVIPLWQSLVTGVQNMFSRTDAEPPVPDPSPPSQINLLKRHHCKILAPKIKISAPKFKYLVPINVALNSNFTDKIQIKSIFVPLQTSHFVRGKLPIQLIRHPPPPSWVLVKIWTTLASLLVDTGLNVLAKNRRNWQVIFIDSGLEVAKTRFQTCEQKCVIHMEKSDLRISCTWNGARRSS